jgi:hypothetical protein
VAAVAIDISFDFRTDATGKNPDPDASSPTLLHYHHLLWSKPLPSGKYFELTPRAQKPHSLLHDSDLGRFLLTSDSVLATFTRRPDMQGIISQLPPADIDALNTITYTIGGMILWPGKAAAVRSCGPSSAATRRSSTAGPAMVTSQSEPSTVREVRAGSQCARRQAPRS